MKKMYQCIGKNIDGVMVQKSDPHTWEEMENVYEEYSEIYDTADIIYIGVAD